MIATFVIPFYGADIGGGAEFQTRRLAENLSIRGVDVEVLTTTIRGLGADWTRDLHEPGVYDINGVTVRRFHPRNNPAPHFGPINKKLMMGQRLTHDEELAYADAAVNSDALYQFIGDHKKERLYFFIPYLFGTSINGSAVAPERSWLIPCLHDEGYAAMELTRRMFDRVNGALFNSNAEMRLALRLFDGMKGSEAILMGEGVDEIDGADAARFRAKHGLGDDPFLLYVGRRDATKNVPLLIQYFTKYVASNPARRLKLYLIGSGQVHIPAEAKGAIVDLGFVSVAEKNDAHAAATALCQPSVMESFSLVVMDSWRCGRPVLVHAACGPTREAAMDSGGGLAFGSYAEFAEMVDFFAANPDHAAQMGRQGQRFVEERYSWGVICTRFKRVLAAAEGAVS
ncbi:MAG: glycosyltransferase family 4 protein [Nitrospinae bacterium]|nr:glycosyltransferase family 4 protein [Nitrospinota bacterium]